MALLAAALTLPLFAVTGGRGAALAKEHAAACADIPAFIVRVRATLEAALYQRRRGSSLGAYQVLRASSVSLSRDATTGSCGALAGAFDTALRRAATARSALEAGVELDQGLEAALALAMNGQPLPASSPPKLPPVPEAIVYGDGCPDLFAIVRRLDDAGGAAGLPARVQTVLADLGARPRCERLRALLAETPPARLPHAVDSVRLDEPDLTPKEATLASPLARCPEFPIVYERLSTAISIGAPRYNAGDAEGCRRTYEETARKLTTNLIAPDRCPVVRDLLRAGLSGAESARDHNEAAWALRRSFDAVLEGPGRDGATSRPAP